MELGRLFLQVIVKKVFKMVVGTAQLTLLEQTIVFENAKIIIHRSLTCHKSQVFTVSIDTSCFSLTQPQLSEWLMNTSFTQDLALPCLPREPLETQAENPLF